MKPLFTVLLFVLTVVLLNQCEKDESKKDGSIYGFKIPDSNFLNALIEVGVDADGDGTISPGETEVITFLNVSGCFIQDLTGIDAFVNMHTLYCHNNQLTTLDVTKCSALELLSCSGNQLASLHVSNSNALKWLYCGDNQLTSLDLSNNIALHSLFCDSNQLGSLDVSKNTALSRLGCDRNQLTSLDVSNNTTLRLLNCCDNQLTTLDVSNNTYLVAMGCGSNQLTTLDISSNAALIWIQLNNLPSLYEVCIWEMPFPPAGVEVDTSGSPNVYFTTDCSK